MIIKLPKGQYIMMVSASVCAMILFNLEMTDRLGVYVPLMAAITTWVSVRLIFMIYRGETGRQRMVQLIKVVIYMAAFDGLQYLLHELVGSIITPLIGVVLLLVLVRKIAID